MATEQTQLRTPNVQDTLNNLGQNKRLVMVGAVVLTILITIFIIGFAWTKSSNKGNEIDLVKSIDQGRAFEIVSKLKVNDLEAKIDDSEFPGKVNVKVYQKDFDKAAISLSRSDLLQEDGFNLFDKSDWAASDYDKRVKMMRAVNGDLSRIISRMTGIKWSTVRVNIPEPQLFSQYQASTTATVQVELGDENLKLSRTQVRSVINLLVGYVPNLQKNNVSIIDTNGETYSAVETEEVAASELLEESERVNKVVQKRIEEYLEPLLGNNNYIVRVSSEISRKKIEESATLFEQGAVGQEQIGDERLASNPQGAVGPAIPGTEGGMGYARSNRVTQNYPSFRQKTVSTPAGRVTQISVALAINRDILPKISVKQLREGIAAITSPNTKIEDVKITVADFITNSAPAKSLPNKTVMPNVGGLLSQFLAFVKGMPRWATITIIVFGLLFIIGSLRKPAVQQKIEQSTVSQINQSMQQNRLPRNEQMIAATVQKPDFSGIITGMKEAAAERPEFLASKLQVWLEEGTPLAR